MCRNIDKLEEARMTAGEKDVEDILKRMMVNEVVSPLVKERDDVKMEKARTHFKLILVPVFVNTFI